MDSNHFNVAIPDDPLLLHLGQHGTFVYPALVLQLRDTPPLTFVLSVRGPPNMSNLQLATVYSRSASCLSAQLQLGTPVAYTGYFPSLIP